MLEVLIFGGLGYAITWYKGRKIAVWSGLAILVFLLSGFAAFLFLIAGPGRFGAVLIEFSREIANSVAGGERIAFEFAALIGLPVACYAGGVYAALHRKRKRGQAI